MGPNLKKYWQLWRNFDNGPQPGPGQEWRDRTVIPQAYKEISTRVPRLVLGMWGVPEPFTVRGRGYRDEEYEETVRVLVENSLDEVGLHDPEGELFIKRMVDGENYCQIVGHVFWKLWWRKESRWRKTRVKAPDGKWTPLEILEQLYDNIEVTWLPITNVAIDLYGKNRWRIERIQTSLEALRKEDDTYRDATGQALYPNLDELELGMMTGFGMQESTSEPRDTEHWPLSETGMTHDPAERPVEVWLCWDNVKGTLTKIANRRMILDEGLSPTPDGLDPYLSVPAIPVPNRPYGDSILNWTGPLHVRQTRLSRARMDQTLMNVFTQYLYREGSLPSTTWLFRPGGLAPVKQLDPSRPILDVVAPLPKQQLPPEAYNEELHTQRMSESVSAADSVSQGVEATTKSRDVTAAEVNQRVVQGATRYQLEHLYRAATLKKPMLQKIFDLLQQNLTQPRILRILDDVEVKVDLQSLNRPIDIVLGDPSTDATMAERLAELDRVIELARPDSPFVSWLQPREILMEMFSSMRALRRSARRLVKSEAEHEQELQRQQLLAAQQTGGGTGSTPSMALPPSVPGMPAGSGSGGAPQAGAPGPTPGSVETL
jgi:hypothetical protein